MKISNLRVGFAGSNGLVEALRGLDLDILPGETLGLVGESGCGKSLTALSILGLLPDGARVAGGSVAFKGRELLGSSEEAYRRIRGKEISLVFQEPFTSLNPVLKVGRQIAESVVLHQGASKEAADKAAVDLLGQVGIADPAARAGQYPHQFSGGMRQRAMIAMALACKPTLLIADEPTTALDVTVQAQILDLLKKLKVDFGLTLMLITHDLSIVADMADRVAVMYAGRIVEQGRAADILQQPRHPYTRALLACIPRLGQVPRRLPTLEGLVPELWQMPEGCSFHPRCGQAIKQCRRQDPALQARGGQGEVACLLY